MSRTSKTRKAVASRFLRVGVMATCLLVAVCVSRAEAVVVSEEAWTNLAANTDTTKTISATHTVTASAGTRRLFLASMVVYFGGDQTITVTSATFGGVALHEIVTGSSSSTRGAIYLGYLLDSEIPSGAQTLSVTFTSAGPPEGKKLLAATYSGVDQITPTTDSAANTVDSTDPIPFGAQIDYLAGAELV